MSTLLKNERSADPKFSEGDTIFTFNYRSDRMREITSVLGLPDKPMEVTIPEDLVGMLNGVVR